MHDEFQYLTELPGTPKKQSWVQDRLEILSEWERVMLTAVTAQQPPATAAEAFNCLLSLEYGSVFSAMNGYEDLGRYQLRAMAEDMTDELIEYADLYALGKKFEEAHPGQFVGEYYVAYPSEEASFAFGGQSVRLKLASSAVPEGVWLSLPDYRELYGAGDEIGKTGVAMKALRVLSLEECTLLDARCFLPEAVSPMKQYDSVTELVRDASQLGCVLDEQGQGEPNWLEKFAAALEYKGCDTLKFALDISQNLQCYEWASCERLAALGAEHLCLCEVPEDLIQSGCIDLRRFAKDLLESDGYMLTGDGEAYVKRNRKEFIYKHSARDSPGQDQQSGMTMQSEGMVMM